MVKIKNKVTEKEAFRFVEEVVNSPDTQAFPAWFIAAINNGTIELDTNRSGKQFLRIHDTVNNHGMLIVNDGDWVIRGLAGELYPCTNDVFEQSYEVVE